MAISISCCSPGPRVPTIASGSSWMFMMPMYLRASSRHFFQLTIDFFPGKSSMQMFSATVRFKNRLSS